MNKFLFFDRSKIFVTKEILKFDISLKNIDFTGKQNWFFLISGDRYDRKSRLSSRIDYIKTYIRTLESQL